MIHFNFETKFVLNDQSGISNWLERVIDQEGFKTGEINYVFCNDVYLHKLNLEFLSHDTLTDIISFDYSIGKVIHGDVFVSVERVEENAKTFQVNFHEELNRVLVHGILHYCGYKDKTKSESENMRSKEDFYLKQLASFS